MTTGIQSCLLLLVNLYLVHFSKIEAKCAGNGLMNCACNFIGACKYDVSNKRFNPFSKSAEVLGEYYIPDVTSLARRKPLGTPQTTEICEPGNFGIIYDCENRIPLAATIVMTADQYNDHAYQRPHGNFRQSSEMADPFFQQNDYDYKDALNRKLCYESQTKKDYYIESNWYYEKNMVFPPLFTECPNNGYIEDHTYVHRGHLIAANYGRGTPGLSRQTFVYTNVVPQFGFLNSGSWQKHESMLIEWARNNCGGFPLHIIVGCIPSTYPQHEKRFFGELGFSDFSGHSNAPGGNWYREYRVNVPSYLWTAACCHSPSNTFTKSTTFYAKNVPKGFSQQSFNLSTLFSRMNADHINLFPGMPSCNDDNNFVSL